MSKDLIKLDRNKIIQSNNRKGSNPLLTIALIRNDISDLVYLQGLFADGNKNIKNVVCAESGQYAGRRIYFMRIFLSHYYEFLIFLKNRKEDIENDTALQTILKNLNKNNLEIWNNFNLLASRINSKEKYKGDNKNIEYKILILAESMRSELTFNYWHTSSHLSNGFKKAFNEDSKNPYNEHPQATELYDLNKDIFIFENEIIDTVANVNFILSKILNKHHNSIKLT